MPRGYRGVYQGGNRSTGYPIERDRKRKGGMRRRDERRDDRRDKRRDKQRDEKSDERGDERRDERRRNERSERGAGLVSGERDVSCMPGIRGARRVNSVHRRRQQI
ncbi:hypothetical protein NDU88_001585 [Pleurodeles waltl]|uniref:Uncharacterized protein n=1 Tax=Pleurodeles waltl TaxID=8319 RepID=A0AAV7VA40_PLEWA|nr:hypothetical protein NDU88_001585 [Pleurodeles waltl]